MDEFISGQKYLKVSVEDDLTCLEEYNLHWKSGHPLCSDYTKRLLREKKTIYILFKDNQCSYTIDYKGDCIDLSFLNLFKVSEEELENILNG